MHTEAHAAEQALEVATLAPVLAVFAPLILSVVMARIGARSQALRNAVGVAACAVSLAATASMLPVTLAGGAAVYRLSVGAIDTPLAFRVDGMALLFALVTALVWTAAAVYSIRYMDHEHARTRFWTFLIATLGADMGVLMAADFLNLFVFFELLAVLSYVLVAHEETLESKDAGVRYMLVGIIGGLSLLAGLALLKSVSGGLGVESAAPALEQLGGLKYLIAGLMIVGFGAKAGMFPIHIWLPRAHPVAPSPASALLSGIMVKAGIYGIIRTVSVVFNPLGPAGVRAPAAAELGLVIIALAVVTMTLGWVLALLQDNLKRLLAYSTISQIGYILMGVGCAAYMGDRGAMGMAGALYHVINHALYKALLFLAAGVILYRLGELSMKRLGGLGRRMPVLTALTAVAVLGIVGAPLFNGYVSKTLLHHAIVKAYEHQHIAWLHWAEILFTVAGGGTVAYYLKVAQRVFLGRPHPELREAGDAPALMAAPMALLAALILVAAWAPHLALNRLVLPGLQGHGFDPGFIAKYIHGIPFFTAEDLLGIGKSIGIGIGIYVMARAVGLLDWKTPKRLSIEGLYELAGRGFLWLCRVPVAALDRALLGFYAGLASGFVRFCRTVPVAVDQWIYRIVASSIPYLFSGWLYGGEWENRPCECNDPAVKACRRASAVHSGRLNAYLGWILIAFTALIFLAVIGF